MQASPPVSADAARTANLLGTHALAVADRLRAATEDAAGLGGAAPAAIVSLHAFAGGRTVDFLRRVLELTPSGAVRLIDRLAAEGLVQRVRGERDAREVL